MREPLAWAAMAMAMGAAIWPLWEPGLAVAVAGAIAAAGLGALLRARRAGRLGWGLAALLLGAASVSAREGEPAPAAAEARQVGEVLATSGSVATVRVGTSERSWRFREQPPPVGARLIAWTRPERGAARLPGSWPREASDALVGRPAERVLGWLPLGAPQPPPTLGEARHRGLLLALATGRRDELPEDERALLQRTGTTHLLSVSGLHIALVASAAAALCRLALAPLALGRWPRAARGLAGGVALVAACAYAGLVGWPVPALRSVWMVGAAVAARSLGRSQRAWSALGLAGCALVLGDPGQVFDASALLSFGAVAGILWVGPRITRWLPPDAPWIVRSLVGALATTAGATAGTLPVAAWIFQELPPLSPLANLVAVPLIGGVATTAALIALGAPEPLAGLALAVGDESTHLALLALRPLACEPLHPAVGPLGALALALALPLYRRPALAGLLLLCGLGLRELPRGGLSVSFLSVGQGDAALLRWPDGRAWLVDGGPPGTSVLGWLRREGVERLEAVVLSHPDADHLGGMIPVLDAMEVGGLWVPREAREDEADYAALLARTRARGVPVRGAGDPLPGALLLAPEGESDNDRGLVLLARYRERSFLFTGDVEADAERWLAPRLGPVDVLKVPHHGSRSSSTPALVAATRPTLAVISVGEGNPFGHPAPEVLARWPWVLRTDQDGTLEVWTDGSRLRVRAWRPGEGWRALPDPENAIDTRVAGR